MRKKARFAWSLVFFGGDVYALVRWLQPEGLTVGLQLGAPEYSLAIVFFTGGLAYVNWGLYRSRYPNPRTILEELADEGMGLYRALAVGQQGEWGLESRMKAGEFAGKAKRINIGCPSPDHPELWLEWLLVFVPLARLSRLKEARQRWKLSG